ncbi:hypothetical protein MC885_014596 [Smutsia gigantea]|nr:hypothetical protein MC885_014596 [Smutsia gigantea]
MAALRLLHATALGPTEPSGTTVGSPGTLAPAAERLKADALIFTNRPNANSNLESYKNSPDSKASAFSERYLGLHGLDNRAYEVTRVAHRVAALAEQRFLIIHATADEKIHFQHTAELITQLIKGKANYSLQIYPDESHYFSSPSLRQHLYRSIIDFFVECFRIQDKVPAATGKEEEEEED